MEINLKGKKALVTGGSGQLGRVIAKTLAACGADVAIHYNSDASSAAKVAEEIQKMGVKAACFQADITKQESVEEMKKAIHETFGNPDILVNNAVIQYEWKSVLEQDIKDYYSQFESCVMQTVYMTKAFLPHMVEQNYGRVIVINTECAAMAEAGCSAYVSGKRGLDGVVRCLAKEVGRHQITVNQVAPGWTISERDRINHTEVQPDYDNSVPLGHRGEDTDIANMVAFLASDLAGFTTGAYIPVSGGRVMPAI